MKPTDLFSFDGPLDRAGYQWRVLGALALQYGFAVVSAPAVLAQPAFWLEPLRELAFVGAGSPVLMVSGAVTVVVWWVLAAASWRRVQVCAASPALAAFVVVPIVQVLVMIWLALLPEVEPAEPVADTAIGPPTARSAVIGLLAGVSIVVGGVLVSTLLFGQYGNAVFLATPFVVGVTTGYSANRDHDIGFKATTSMTAVALVLGGLMLLALAIEGVICLILALPLIGVMGLFGSVLGRVLADHRRGRRATMLSTALLPLMLLSDQVLPPQARFVSAESIEIAASPAAVWDSVVHMGPIPDAPRAPFRWGLAYPVRGTIRGAGVGAVREGVFSTGVAYERVTSWQPGRKLGFIVLSDPPMMTETSPYGPIHPAHLTGYFRTEDAVFTIDPIGPGRTRLTLTTHHALDLAPVAYWTPIAQWAVHENKRRVLAHFRDQAEGR
jgi:hypothetical protein